MSDARPDRVSLVAGGALCLLGTALLLDQLDLFSLRLASAAALLCAAVGAMLVAWALLEEPGDRSEPPTPVAEGRDGRGRWRRDTDVGILGGVLAGVALRTGADPTLIRVVFAATVVVTGGLALAAYAIAWLLMPAEGGRAILATGAPGGPRRGLRLGAGVGLITLAGLLAFRSLGIWWSDALVWPLVLAAAGAALLWSQSRARAAVEPAPASPLSPLPPERASEVEERSERTRLVDLYRGGFGVALVLGAALLFLSQNDALGVARDAAFTAIVSILALALILAPFIWRLGRNLATERAERIRSQERADLAAHLHDSVLQTLTLMQKRADDPREVAALARRQERELRAWLAADGTAPASGGFAAALRAAAEEVEDAHRVTIDVVTVGDRELDERAGAVVGAAREALTNAAKFAGEGPISAYAEVGDEGIEVYVRDRGGGFDPEAVPADRRGISESIAGRMRRHGGDATISSVYGSGTEVALTMEREPE